MASGISRRLFLSGQIFPPVFAFPANIFPAFSLALVPIFLHKQANPLFLKEKS